MKLKNFFIALVAMVACFSEAFAQQVITVSNAEELKQALKEAGAAPQARQAAQGGAPTYPGSTITLDQYKDASVIEGYFTPEKQLVLDLNGYVVYGDITIKSGQLSIIDNKGTGAWIGCITVDDGAKLAVGSGNVIAGESGVAVINEGTLSTDGGAVIGKITNTGSGSMEGVANYNTALVANTTVAQAALNAALNEQAIQFASDIEGDLTAVQKPNTKITIDGNGKTLKGTIIVDGKSSAYATTGVTIKDLNFDATAITTDASINLGVKGNNNTRYTNYVTVKNCTFTDNDYSAAAVKSYTGGDKNLVIKGCTATGMHSLAQLANVEEGLVIDSCTANTKNGINLGSSAGVQITKNTINVKGYGVRIGASSGGESGTITMTENTLTTDNTEGDPVIVLRGTAPDQVDLKMSENSVSGNVHISGTTANTKISAEANYWSGKENPVVAEGSTPVVVNSYYTDAARTTLERNEMGSVNAFVSADRISGDVTHNAVESLVIQILDADNNVIGTSTLTNDKYIDGTKHALTWRINLGEDDSDSWAMNWAGDAPSIDKMPAKVKVLVDDVAVGENTVKFTQNGDGKNPVFAAKTKDGKISSFIVSEGFGFSKAAATLVSAAVEGDNIAILKEGTYTVPTGKNLTITGKVAGVKFDMSKAVGVHSSMTFNNVTFEYSTNKNYIGLQHAGTMVYNNCTIDGQVFLYGASETFNNCTFKQDSSDAYNVWTYGAKEVAFNDCTFNSKGKSVLIYAESASIFNNVTVSRCTFNASTAVEGKAAIEMDSSLTGGINLTIDAATTATGFGTGNVSGNSLWNNKKGNGNNANNDITVTVDGETVLAPEYAAKIGETGHRILQEAINAVKDGETITLVSDVTENVTVSQVEGVSFVIDGQGKKFDGTITLDGNSRNPAAETLTIQNVNFETSTASRYFIDANDASADNRYSHNVTIKDCNFTAVEGSAAVHTAVAARFRQAFNIKIEGGVFTNMHSVLQAYGVAGVEVSGVKTDKCKSGVSFGTSTNAALKNVEFAGCVGYGVRVDAEVNTTLTIENAKIDAFIPVVARKATANYNVTFNGENTMRATNTDGIWFAAGTSEYEVSGTMPTAATGKVRVVLSGTGLSEEGIYGNYYDELTIHVASQTATTSVTREIYVATMDEAVAEAKTFNAGTVIYKVYDAVELTTGGSHGILDLGQNVVIEGANDAAKLTIVGGGVPDIKGVTFKNITLADEGTYLPTANEFMYQNYIDCTFENVKFVDGIRLSGTSVIKDSQVEANTTNEYAIWLDAGVFTMTGTTVVGGADAYGLIKSDLVSKITITGNTFQYLGEANKEALNTKGAVIIAENNTFIDCAAGILPADKTNYADDSKTTVLTDADIAENNTITVYYAAIGEQKYETLLAAIKAAQEGETITLIRNVTMDYNARDAYETQAQNLVIDGNGKTLTLNQKNSDWASFGLANNSKLVLKNMTIEKTGYGDTSGAWNTHAIIFSCPVEMSNVTVNNAIAVQAGATLNNVTINEAYGYYGLWINGNGQAVTINGGAINANNGGRGIKIADEYIDNPAQITLSVDGTVFTTAKKAAVLVSSKAGANITASNVNIENVAEDKVNFVWVDEDWAQYFDQVEVTGATVSPEGGEGSFAAAIIVDGTVQSYFKTFAKALETVANGQTITLITDVAENVTIKQVVGKNITIDGNSKNYTGTITVVGDGVPNGSNKETLTFKNINFVVKANAYAITAQKNTHARNITVENCKFTGAANGPSYGIRVRNGWNYAVKNTTADGLSSFFNATENLSGLTVEDVTVTKANSAFNAVYGFGKATFKNVNISVAAEGIWVQNQNAFNLTLEDCSIEASKPIYVAEYKDKNNTNTITLNGTNNLVAASDGNWLTIVDEPATNATFKVVANDTALDFEKTSGLAAYAKNDVRSFAYNDLRKVVNESADSDVVAMLADATVNTKTYTTQNDGYAVLFNVGDKAVTFDLNGKKLSVSAAAADLAAAKGKMLLSVFSADLDGDFIITDSSADGSGAVELAVNDASVYSMFVSESAQNDKSNSGKLTVNSGSFTTVGKVSNAMFFSDADEVITINGGTFFCDGASNTSGYPWFVNTLGNNELQVNVYGGTFNIDINHQYRPFEVFVPETLAVKSNGNGTWTIVPAQAYVTEMLGDWNNVAGSREHKVGYATVADALAATNELGKTVTLVWSEGDAPIAMNGSVFGKDVTIKGTAKVDWSKGWLFVGRGGEGNATVTFDGANLTSASNSASYGIHVSGREKNTTNKYDGTLVIKNSTIELDYLINKGNMTLDNSTLTVKNGFSVGGRPASETESGEDATATVALNNASKLVVNNHNGMGLGYEAIGVMNVDATSTFETTQSFLVTAKGTMNIAGQAIVAGTLTNNGVINLTTEEATLEAQEGLNIATTLLGYFVKYANGVYTVCGEIVLVDGEVTDFVNEKDMIVKTLTYTRTFQERMLGKWQTLYVPFEIPVSELNAMGYEVAYFNDFRETLDEYGQVVANGTVLEMIIIRHGVLKANFPYAIKPKTEESLEMSLVLNDVKLYSTTGERESVECSSAFKRFTFDGTYKTATKSEIVGNDDVPFYAMNVNGIMQAMGPDPKLGAFRVYMTITKKNGEPFIQTPGQAALAREIPLHVIGEEDENGATIIYDVVEDSLNGNDFIYDLQGRRVSEPKKGGIYIKNGKKILY